MGFPLDLHSNSNFVIMAANESWGSFHQQFERAPVTLRVMVSEVEDSVPPAPPVYSDSRHLLMIVSDAQNFAVCDLREGFASCRATPALITQSAFFRYCFLEAMGYSTLTAAHLAPIHAACVEWADTGLLLTGDSGAGKSTLAFACAKAGFTYISDDGCYLLRGGDGRTLKGNPFVFRLRENATTLFPELAGHPVTFRPNGKPTIELRTREFPNLRTKESTRVRYVLFLRRKEGESPSLHPFSKQEALDHWAQSNCYGHEEMRAGIHHELTRFTDAELYEFRYSNLEPAVDFLKELALS